MPRPHATAASRRAFIAGALAIVAIASSVSRIAAQTPEPMLRVYLVVPDSARDLLDGALFGALEARATATLLRRSIAVVTVPRVAGFTAPTIPAGDVAAIVGGHDSASVSALAAIAHGASLPFISLVALPGSRDCSVSVLHLLPADGERAQARSGREGSIVAWHPSLFRYGAEQLNDRFRAQFRRGMTEPAWAGWMAFRILGDSFVRSRARTSADLVAWLTSPRARFDGHKGVPLAFDDARGLRQPLYLLSPDGNIVEQISPTVSTSRQCDGAP